MTGDGDWYPSPSEPDPLCSFFFFFFFFLLLKASFSWALSMVCSFISFLSVFLSTYQRVNCQISPWLNSQISRLSCLIELYKCFNDWILINLSTMQFWRAYTWHSELRNPPLIFSFSSSLSFSSFSSYCCHRSRTLPPPRPPPPLRHLSLIHLHLDKIKLLDIFKKETLN